MKTLEECATLDELADHAWGTTDITSYGHDSLRVALQRAAELGRQQGWNEAIEAVIEFIRRFGEAYIHDVLELKMPTKEKP
jgi:hypothetical protein